MDATPPVFFLSLSLSKTHARARGHRRLGFFYIFADRFFRYYCYCC